MNWYATILILHYEDNALTDQCIKSLIGQAVDCCAQIVVVDNASPTPYRSEYERYDLLKVVRNEQNLPIVPALARWMPVFPNEVYGLLNNDLICHAGMLSVVLTCFDDPDVGIVAPGSSDRGTGILYVSGPGAHGSVVTEHVDNHCFWINHALTEEIGYPETDGHADRRSWGWNKYYCWKARQAGFKVIAARDAYVEHFGGTFSEEANRAGYEWLAGRLGERIGEAW
jgi:GT2 family glycosyltransferase